MQIQFIGGVGTVTGSKTILKYKGYSLLIDCGLFQGLKENRLKNWQPFIHDPEKIDAIILTHAHLDHCGYIPRFLAEGYKGEIYCSKATFSLCKIILPDSGYLQEEEARFRNKTKSTKHHPALPLYTEEQAKLSLDSFVTIALHQPFKLGPFSVEYLDAGHILGACSVKITSPEGKSILFSGDLGRYNDLLMTSPENRSPSNYVVMETTYGNRLHSKEDPLKVLKNILERIISKNGILLIPSFAVGRAQSLIYAFHKIFDSYPNLKIPMYLNSPMASDVTELYEQYPDEHKLTKKQYYNLFQDIHIVNSLDESKALNQKTGPIIIISASGMLSGGRILHHLKAYSAGENNAILLVGFQAPGTRGHNLQQGNRILKIHGQEYKVNAEVFEIDNLSAHADQEELLKWLNSSSLEGIKKVFLVHGEKEASTEIEKIINETLLLKTSIPSPGDKFDL